MWIFFFLSEYSVLPILVYWSVTTLSRYNASKSHQRLNLLLVKELFLCNVLFLVGFCCKSFITT